MEEPERKSFLDVLKRNLNLADKFAFITRIMYMGEYSGNYDDLLKTMKNNVKELNEELGESALSGLFIVYPKYFIHIIEASEETLYRHFQTLIVPKTLEDEEFFRHIILLPAFYNVFRCFFSDWYDVYVSDPPWLLDKIENIELEEIKSQFKICLSKMYELSEYLFEKGERSQEKTIYILKSIPSEMPHLLLEVTRIEYLLKVNFRAIVDLRDFLNQFVEVPFFNFYNDRIWPPIKSLAPESNFKVQGIIQ